MKIEQEPKYDVDIETGNIVNRETNIAIPSSEPIFIMRAKDKNAALAIAYYKNLCLGKTHKTAVTKRLHHFVKFAHEHPTDLKEPNTPKNIDWLFVLKSVIDGQYYSIVLYLLSKTRFNKRK